MVFGTTIHLPCDFFSYSLTSAAKVPDQLQLSNVKQLRSTMSCLTATPPRHPSKSSSQVPANFSCSHVFIQKDAVRQTLQPPNNELFTIIQHKQKFDIIWVNEKSQSVSIDPLTPAFLLDDATPGPHFTLPLPTNFTSVHWRDRLTL